MKDNPFYQVSGEVVVAAGTRGYTSTGPIYKAWRIYCEEPIFIGDLDFDSEGLMCDEYNLSTLEYLASKGETVVYRDFDRECANRLISVSL